MLGPCLFLFYINDIAEDLSSTVRLFADDTMIYLTVQNNEDAERLQQDLNKLCDWEAKWLMEFHPDKCEVISITRKKNPICYPYQLHGHQFKHADQVKYLGVNISSDFQWDKHVASICDKANRSLGLIRRNVNISNATVKAQAYKLLVSPILEYSQTVWDPHTASATKKLESVQRRAAQYATGRYRHMSSVSAMLNELHWETLASRRRTARLVMFYKIHHNIIAIGMPLVLKYHLAPTRVENSQAYHIPPSTCDYHLYAFYQHTVRDWNYLPENAVMATSPEAFGGAIRNL